MIDFVCPPPQKLDSLRSGSLEPHLQGFAALLARQGFCQIYSWRKLRLAAALGQWLEKRRLHPRQLNEQHAKLFSNSGKPGPSPRVWGIFWVGSGMNAIKRTIPTRVGNIA